MSGGINPTVHTAAVAALEAALNRALQLAPATRTELQQLEDCVFALHCTSPVLDVYLQPANGEIRLMGLYDGPVTTSVRGVASDFTELATSTDPTATLINGQLELVGDSGPLIQLQQVLSALDMDWEAPLVDTLGDVAGHQLATLLRNTFSWGKQASGSLARQLDEFIHEEARLSPPRLEVEDFYRDVQELGQRVERLQSRAKRLRQRLQKLGELKMSRALRLATILRTVGRYRLDEFIDSQRLPTLPRLALRLSPWRLQRVPDLPRGVRLRRALEELGPVFIKFGQMLSTRRDLLPEDIADELAKLQDNVPPFPSEQAIAIIEQSLGKPVNELFASFETTPMASASVAQVHAATLHSGEQAVVKVVRPDIEPVIRQDLALMFALARLVAKYLPEGKRLRPVEVVADYKLVILDELDLGREASNASQLRRNFEDSKLVYIPEVYWDYSSHNVFTMERIHGIPVTDMDTLRAKGTDLKVLGERGVEIFFTQVFRDSFFHADMHPGNIFVDASNPADPTYIAVDCAIVGSLSDADQYYLARNLLGIFRRDYHEVAQLHVECGWVPPHTRVQDFESAMRAVCEPIFEKPISEISFGQLLVYLFRTASRFDMEVQPSLVLLQKTLLNIEGLGRQLYPELNLWDTAQPFLEEWVQDRYSPQSVFKRLQRHAPSWLEQLPQLPDVVLDNLQQARDIEPRFTPQRANLEDTQEQDRDSKRQRRRYLLGSLACAGAVISVFPDAWQQLLQAPLLSWLLAALALSLLWPRDS